MSHKTFSISCLLLSIVLSLTKLSISLVIKGNEFNDDFLSQSSYVLPTTATTKTTTSHQFYHASVSSPYDGLPRENILADSGASLLEEDSPNEATTLLMPFTPTPVYIYSAVHHTNNAIQHGHQEKLSIDTAGIVQEDGSSSIVNHKFSTKLPEFINSESDSTVKKQQETNSNKYDKFLDGSKTLHQRNVRGRKGSKLISDLDETTSSTELHGGISEYHEQINVKTNISSDRLESNQHMPTTVSIIETRPKYQQSDPSKESMRENSRNFREEIYHAYENFSEVNNDALKSSIDKKPLFSSGSIDNGFPTDDENFNGHHVISDETNTTLSIPNSEELEIFTSTVKLITFKPRHLDSETTTAPSERSDTSNPQEGARGLNSTCNNNTKSIKKCKDGTNSADIVLMSRTARKKKKKKTKKKKMKKPKPDKVLANFIKGRKKKLKKLLTKFAMVVALLIFVLCMGMLKFLTTKAVLGSGVALMLAIVTLIAKFLSQGQAHGHGHDHGGTKVVVQKDSGWREHDYDDRSYQVDANKKWKKDLKNKKDLVSTSKPRYEYLKQSGRQKKPFAMPDVTKPPLGWWKTKGYGRRENDFPPKDDGTLNEDDRILRFYGGYKWSETPKKTKKRQHSTKTKKRRPDWDGYTQWNEERRQDDSINGNLKRIDDDEEDFSQIIPSNYKSEIKPENVLHFPTVSYSGKQILNLGVASSGDNMDYDLVAPTDTYSDWNTESSNPWIPTLAAWPVNVAAKPSTDFDYWSGKADEEDATSDLRIGEVILPTDSTDFSRGVVGWKGVYSGGGSDEMNLSNIENHLEGQNGGGDEFQSVKNISDTNEENKMADNRIALDITNHGITNSSEETSNDTDVAYNAVASAPAFDVNADSNEDIYNHTDAVENRPVENSSIDSNDETTQNVPNNHKEQNNKNEKVRSTLVFKNWEEYKTFVGKIKIPLNDEGNKTVSVNIQDKKYKNHRISKSPDIR